MTILFIWNYHYFPFEKGKSRFSDFLDELAAKGHDVEVVCSTFYHMGKSFRDVSDPRLACLPYKTTLIPELGYKKNISFRRWRSIRAFNRGVERFLSNHDGVDEVYIPIPSNELALIGERFAQRVGAKVILDIEDLWPESFRMIKAVRPFYRPLFGKSEKRRARTLAQADGLVAVSQTYLNLGLASAKAGTPAVSAPIGADVEYVRALQMQHVSKKKPGEFWVGYIGTLSKSYDLYTVIDALDALAIAHFDNFVLKIMGSGPNLEDVRKYASKKHGKVEFLGLLPYNAMCEVLFDCDVGLNPIIATSVSSLINKIADYAACSVPVINTQQSAEYRSLLANYEAGWNIWPKDVIALQKALVFALKHPEQLIKAKQGALSLAVNELNRADSQRKMLGLIESLGGKKQ